GGGREGGGGCGVALAYGEAAGGELLAQRKRQRRAGDQRSPERGGVRPRLRRGIEQNFQEVRRAEIAARPEMRDRLELLLGMTGARGDSRPPHPTPTRP